MNTEARIAAWRAGLPARLDAAATAWSVTLGDVLSEAPTRRVIAARGPRGEPLVLKCTLPGPPMHAEQLALAAFAGRGVPRMLAGDPAVGLLLLERAVPGLALRHLARHDDDAATRAASLLIATLPMPAPAAGIFVKVTDWRRTLATAQGRLPPTVLDRAAGLLLDLTAAGTERLLLHGDLHHDNIVSRGNGWCAIDPKGLIGERAVEAAPLLRRHADPAVPAQPRRRAALIAETTGLDRARIAGWGYVGAVVTAAHIAARGQDAAHMLAVAEALMPLTSPRGSG